MVADCAGHLDRILARALLSFKRPLLSVDVSVSVCPQLWNAKYLGN